MEHIARQFGKSLDADDFESTKSLLSPDCQYHIGKQTLIGPEAICHSYESNMLEGRKKLDQLVWGDSQIESINNQQFYVHFTDYLTHKGLKYTHRCQQRVTINEKGQIEQIEHIENEEEQQKLNDFYKKVGLL